VPASEGLIDGKIWNGALIWLCACHLGRCLGPARRASAIHLTEG
jgi:hypothetical protein